MATAIDDAFKGETMVCVCVAKPGADAGEALAAEFEEAVVKDPGDLGALVNAESVDEPRWAVAGSGRAG